MNKSTVLSSSALIAVMLACASSSPTQTQIEPVLTNTASYTLEQAEEATTGSQMIRVASAFQLPTYSPVKPYNFIGDKMEVKLKPDQVWVATEETEGGYVLRSNAASYRVHIRPDGYVEKGFYFPAIRTWARPANLEGPHFETIEGAAVEGSFAAELIYSGRSGDTIRLVYREYLDGLARPAFTQELEYDLAESTSIAFKSLEIDVLEATNSRIHFLVKDDGGLPWLPNR